MFGDVKFNTANVTNSVSDPCGDQNLAVDSGIGRLCSLKNMSRLDVSGGLKLNESPCLEM